MPCYRCGARQTDPARGPSPWKRGVRAQTQVLICPDCQRGRDWAADLDHCPRCGSTALARSLGVTGCRQCGSEGIIPVQPERASATVSEPQRRALRADVDAALDRIFGRAPAAPAGYPGNPPEVDRQADRVP